MPDINTTAQAGIGDDSYTGVVTNTVIAALHGVFVGQNAASMKPTHIAVGTGTQAAQPSDTELENETHRWPVTQLTQSGTAVTALLNLTAASGNFSATEMGVFAGDTMLSRANVEIEKNASSIINIVWVLTIQGG